MISFTGAVRGREAVALPGSLMVRADADWVRQAVMALIDNAIKYSPEDSVVDVKMSVNGDIRMSVTDQGRGFGDADVETLKGRFARGVNVDDIVGSGLGLTIADEGTGQGPGGNESGHIQIASNHGRAEQ